LGKANLGSIECVVILAFRIHKQQISAKILDLFCLLKVENRGLDREKTSSLGGIICVFLGGL
jgi:hypothetical protein